MSLRSKSIKGVLYTFIDSFFVKGIIIVSSLLIARNIGPHEYGIYGMIVVFIALGTSLTEGGLSSSLIRSKNIDDKDLSTVFYTNIIMSLVIYVILYMSSNWIAAFYNQESLILLVKVCCLMILISSFSAVQMAILTREMKFKRILQCNLIATAVGAAVGIYLAYNGGKVWSLVYMYLSTQCVLTLTLWIQSNWTPGLTFSKEKLKRHYKFGYKLMLAGLLDRGFKNIYNVLMGKYFAASSVGFFERANSLSSFPSLTVSTVIGKVTYPMMSKIQSDQKKISEIYQSLIKLTFFVSAPLMLSLASIADQLFDFLLGEKWLTAAKFFQILCLGTLFYPVSAFNINVLKVYGRSDLFLKLEMVKKVISLILIVIAIQFGILALVWSSVLTSVLSLLINTYYSGEMIGYSLKRQLTFIIPLLALAIVIFYSMYIFGLQIESYHIILRIVLPIAVGIILFVTINYFAKNEALFFLINMLKTILK